MHNTHGTMTFDPRGTNSTRPHMTNIRSLHLLPRHGKEQPPRRWKEPGGLLGCVRCGSRKGSKGSLETDPK